MDRLLTNDWYLLLKNELNSSYFHQLQKFIDSQKKRVFPEKTEIFTALQLTSYEHTKVVILGQDPYHGFGQAHGLSFSVRPGVSIPPSLKNIYKELNNDLGLPIPSHGCLEHWAKQGVLLLNTVLTVNEGQPNSHKGKGWETFTDKIISLLNERKKPVVFIFWGKHASQKRVLITNVQHFIVEAAHPSPFSAYRGFFGSRPFSKTNEFLTKIGVGEIDWKLP